jgi:hypothetical protein
VFGKRKIEATPDGALNIAGAEFLKLTDKWLAKRSKETLKLLPKNLGKRAPRTYESLGRMIVRADNMGCCFFGCPGSSQEAHTLQYLCARSSSFARGALKLATMAFYDEALVLVRSLAEIANLFALFYFEKTSLQEWKTASRKDRRDKFSPVAVRMRLEKSNGIVMVDEDKYRKLCELSTHPVPELHPQAFNPSGKGMTGGLLVQPAGFLVALNETTGLLTIIVFCAALLLKIPKESLNVVRKDCLAALRERGGVSVDTISDLLKPTPK